MVGCGHMTHPITNIASSEQPGHGSIPTRTRASMLIRTSGGMDCIRTHQCDRVADTSPKSRLMRVLAGRVSSLELTASPVSPFCSRVGLIDRRKRVGFHRAQLASGERPSLSRADQKIAR